MYADAGGKAPHFRSRLGTRGPRERRGAGRGDPGTGTILVDAQWAAAGRTVAYCRVSSADQREDLERQAGRVAAECGRRGISLDATITKVGSRLDGNQVQLRELLSDPDVTMIVVEHLDRLARFGAEHLQAALSATGRSIIVLNPGEDKDDLVRDMAEVLTSMCARLYGPRSAGKRVGAAVRAAQSTP